MYDDLKMYEDKMGGKTVKALENEYVSIRAGRANPHVLDKVTVDYYGQPTPLSQVGTVSVPEGRVLLIQPWDASILKEIERAILGSDVGITPNSDGKVIRLVFPELTEERRKDLTKDVKKKKVKVQKWQSETLGEMPLIILRKLRKPMISQKMI